jgi:hypothetical protein
MVSHRDQYLLHHQRSVYKHIENYVNDWVGSVLVTRLGSKEAIRRTYIIEKKEKMP